MTNDDIKKALAATNERIDILFKFCEANKKATIDFVECVKTLLIDINETLEKAKR